MAEETRNAKLILGVETRGDAKASGSISNIVKSATALRGELSKIDRASELDTLAKDMAKLAVETGDTEKALGKLNAQLAKMGASEDEVRNVARAFSDARRGADGSDGGGGGNLPAAAKFRGAASLVGGGEIVGFIDDIQDAVEGVQQLGGSISSVLNPATIAAGAAVVALALVVDDFAKAAQKQAEAIDQAFSAQRDVFDEIAGGATRADVEETIAQLQFRRELEKITLQEAADAYASYEQQIRDSFGAFGEIVLGFLRILDPREESLNTQKAESEKRIQESEAREHAYRQALERGLTAKNDARAAEEALQKTRDETAREAEQEAERQARDQERAAAEASRIQEQAAREAQQQTEKAAAAQQKYTDSISNAATQYKQASQDINTKLSQALSDNLTGLFRDVEDLSTQFRRDTFDADLKANQAERDALTEHLRDIEDIRNDALKSEREAIQEGDFKQLFLARQAKTEALREEQKSNRREGEDRKQTNTDARADLLRNAQRERADRMLAYERSNVDARTAAQRELQQAQTARTRSLEAAAQAYRAELAQLSQYLQARNQLQTQANQQALQQMGIPGRGISGAGIGGAGISGQGIPARMLGQIIR